jgi:hypothetical protein
VADVAAIAESVVADQADPHAPTRVGNGWFRHPLLWDLFPVAVSLVTSTAFIIRSVMFIGGQRFYVLFDDAAISMTYARNLAQGHGLVWMVGQPHVEGYSNFLWTLWMAVIEWFGPSDRMAGLWVMISGAALLAANTYLICRITRRLAPASAVAPVLAGLAAALYYGLDSWTLEGMETGLVAFLYSGAVLCAIRACDTTDSRSDRLRMLIGTAVLLSLAVLTRDDALIMAAVVAVFIWHGARDRLRDASIAFVPVLIVAAGHIAFRLAYYGRPFPNTYYLKTGGIPLSTRIDRGWVVVAQNFTMQLVVAVLLAAAYFLLARRNGGRATRGTGLLAAAFVAQVVYLVYVGGDSYDVGLSDRYLAIMVPFLFVLAVLGACRLADLHAQARSPIVLVGLGAIAAGAFVKWSVLPLWRIQLLSLWNPTDWVALLWVVGGLFVVFGLLGRSPAMAAGIGATLLVVGAVVTTNGVQMQEWWASNYYGYALNELVATEGQNLADVTPPGTTVATTGAGNVPFFSHRPSIDLFGYSDEYVANTKPHTSVYVPGFGYLPLAFQPGHDKWNYAYSIGKLRPDVVLGLVDPTPEDLANMKTWGYRATGTGTYYLPGKVDPAKL